MSEGEQGAAKEDNARQIVASALTVAVFLFGAIDLVPRYGAYYTTLIAVVILVQWWLNGRAAKAWTAITAQRWSARTLLTYLWEPGLVIVILLGTLILYGIDELPFTWGCPIYRLHVGDTVSFDGGNPVQEVTSMFPYEIGPNDNTSTYQKEKAQFRRWRSLMGQGAKANGTPLYCIRGKVFGDCYADFDAKYTVADGYTVNAAWAFLEHDVRALSKGSRHRPRLRQMPVDIMNNLRTVEVTLEQPAKNEQLILFLRVGKRGGSIDSVEIKKCFINDSFEVN